jgi:hypothetical protein
MVLPRFRWPSPAAPKTFRRNIPLRALQQATAHVLYHKPSSIFQHPATIASSDVQARLACSIVACFPEPLMPLSQKSLLSWLFAATVCTLSAFAGCYVGTRHQAEHWTAADTTLGEEHEIPYPQATARELTEDALRGDGILFERQPDDSIITMWRNADFNTPSSSFSLFVNTPPRYRYEIQILPEGDRKSKIIVNVRTESIPDDQLASYKASNRFELFKEIDELASKAPPASSTPASGGVNFTLLPDEDLKALAKRSTGNANNWQEIAKDNGISSPTDVTPFENVWVPNNLLKRGTP